ncbi:hypothetical protein CEUSTIGMA_g10587.t1 [Chlamydomonas eustigma]|uniref:RAP domain-containing protein n=1 Tax=Chlamydomonas eustigma TaxID=1157962 RepID=A0A250XJ94_9CHLO|nr:hypothetical protein CEUSTIGMA_g10587.t1 [Chlamydomonas eustigma]|eukprot:GAX83161.1 hypothetical protein CEUSTIGMA_g10587.t1 [Chlamydomonas eustigma]
MITVGHRPHTVGLASNSCRRDLVYINERFIIPHANFSRHTVCYVVTEDTATSSTPADLGRRKVQDHEHTKQHDRDSSKRRKRDSMHPNPRHLTFQICDTHTVQELNRLVSCNSSYMNAIHVAAALVRLANLEYIDERLHESLDGVSAPEVASQHAQAESLQAAKGDASELLSRLGAMYVEFCELGAYCGARQHANVAWALGKCAHLPQPIDLLQTLNRELLADDSRRLKSAVPQEISNLALGLAKVCYTDPNIWSAISSVATSPKILTSFKPQELANLAWTCVSGPQQDQTAVQELLLAVVQQSAGQVAHFRPQELASVLRAVAKRSLPDQGRLLDAAAAHCLSLLSSKEHKYYFRLNSQDLANLIWAFAKVGYRNETLLEVLGDAVTASFSLPPPSSTRQSFPTTTSDPYSRLSPLKPQELSIVLWAYATLQYNHEGVLWRAMHHLTLRSSQLSPQSLANACWAAGRMLRLRLSQPARPAESYELHHGHNRGFTERSRPAIEEPHGIFRFLGSMTSAAASKTSFSGQQISNTLWGLVQILQSCWVPSSRTISSDAPVALIHSQDKQDDTSSGSRGASSSSSSSSDSARSVQRQLREGLKPLERAASLQVGAMAPIALAQVAWAGSVLHQSRQQDRGYRNQQQLQQQHWQHASSSQQLAEAVSSEALSRIDQFGAQELCTLVHSLAQAGWPADWALFQAVADAAVPLLRNGEFTPAGMANLVWAYGMQEHRHETLAQAVTQAALPVLRDFGLVELANLLWGLYRLYGLQDPALLKQAASVLNHGMYLREGTLTCYKKEDALQVQQQQSWEGNMVMESSTQYGSIPDMRGVSLSKGNPTIRPSRNIGMSLSVIAWCFARSRYCDSQLYNTLALRVIPHLHCIPPYNLTQLLWAMCAQGVRNAPLLDAAAEILIERVASSQFLKARKGYVLQELDDTQGYRQPHWDSFNMSTSSDASLNQESLHPGDTSVVMWVYAKLRYVKPRLFTAILNQALSPDRSVTQLNASGWRRLAWACSTLGLPEEDAVVERLQQRMRRESSKQVWQVSYEGLKHDRIGSDVSVPVQERVDDVPHVSVSFCGNGGDDVSRGPTDVIQGVESSSGFLTSAVRSEKKELNSWRSRALMRKGKKNYTVDLDEDEGDSYRDSEEGVFEQNWEHKEKVVVPSLLVRPSLRVKQDTYIEFM